MTQELTPKQNDVLGLLPDTRRNIAEELGISIRAVRYRMEAMEDEGMMFQRDSDGTWRNVTGEMKEGYKEQRESRDSESDENADEVDSEASQEKRYVEGLEVVDGVVDDEPDPSDLTTREEYIVGELETGATIEELANDLGIRPSVVKANLTEIYKQGWKIYHDETSDRVAIESDRPLRSSEHKGTRTRKANRWWELNHNELVREFRGLNQPDTKLRKTSGNEDWVTHMTDLHAGDIVRNDEGDVLYETDMIPEVIDYITKQSIHLSEKYNSEYDTAHLLWGGDFLTGESIYEGQFEDLDAWLDEQHDVLIEPLLRQIKRFSEEFDAVQVVCQVGNHGQHRASASSRQANADLILYKSIRNAVSQIQKYSDVLGNVKMLIGEAKPFRNFDMRGGEVKGHLRHGQHRKPQAETSKRESQWRGTLIDHQFNLAYMGHFHISGRIPWDGPPVIVSSSPKPSDHFVEKIGGRVSEKHQNVATVHGVSDDGLTAVFPVDMRNYRE